MNAFPARTNACPDHMNAFPDRMNAFPDHMNAFPDHMNAFSDRTNASSARMSASSARTSASSARTSALPDRMNAFSDHTNAFPARTNAFPDRMNAFPDRMNAFPDHMNAFSDRTNAFPARTNASSDRTNASSDRTNASSDHMNASSDHTHVFPDRMNAFPDRTNEAANPIQPVRVLLWMSGRPPTNDETIWRIFMRKSPGTSFVLAVLFFLAAAPSAHAKKTMVDTIKSAAVSGATSLPIEFAVKAASALIYNNACPARSDEAVGKFLCDTLGDVSGRAEQQWKEEVDRKLTAMSQQLGVIDKNVERLQSSMNTNHKEIQAHFEQAATKVIATKITVRIDNLWKTFRSQLKEGSNTSHAALVDFANEVIAEKLPTKLGDLNVVLTQNELDGQPMLRYPFYLWRIKHAHWPREAWDPRQTYSFAEEKFGYYLGEEEKLYLVYLWAAEILESQCEMNPATCGSKPPVSSLEFKKRFDGYRRDQVAAFNAATNWFILEYSYPHSRDERFLAGYANSGTTEEVLLRANLLTAAILGDGGGLWGQVLTMGNKWDGSLEAQCGAKKEVLKPFLSSTVAVKDPSGSLDWWTSDNADRVYNQVRFASEWTVYQYQMPDVPTGKCTVNATLPNRAGMLPWVEPDTEVTTIGSGENARHFGSFLAIQRAGGAYALASGEWKRRGEPFREEDGSADRTEVRFNWKIEPNHSGGAWAGLWSSGRGKYVLGSGSRVHTYHQIYLYNPKNITFPEDSLTRLVLDPGIDCLDLCDGTSDVVLEYNIENDDSKKGHGSLDANAAIFFDPRTGALDSIANAKNNLSFLDVDNGIRIDASYGKTGDHKSYRTGGEKIGNVRSNPTTQYHLHYLIDFQVFTEGRGLDSTRWNYKARLTPFALYLRR
jgi:hypothetical protein